MLFSVTSSEGELLGPEHLCVGMNLHVHTVSPLLGLTALLPQPSLQPAGSLRLALDQETVQQRPDPKSGLKHKKTEHALHRQSALAPPEQLPHQDTPPSFKEDSRCSKIGVVQFTRKISTQKHGEFSCASLSQGLERVARKSRWSLLGADTAVLCAFTPGSGGPSADSIGVVRGRGSAQEG